MRPPGGLLALDRETTAVEAHTVQFYDENEFPAAAIAEFLAPPLRVDDPAIIISTREHYLVIEEALATSGVDVARALVEKRLVHCEARRVLTEFMADGHPDPERFNRAIVSVLDQLGPNGIRAHAYGEMVALLCEDGETAAAIELERLWNHFLCTRHLPLLCAYPLSQFDDGSEPFRAVCAAHGEVRSIHLSPISDVGRLSAEIEHTSRVLEREAERRRQLEATAEVTSGHISKLHKITSAFSESTTPTEVARVATTEMMRVLGADRALLAIVDNDKKHLRTLATPGGAPLHQLVEASLRFGRPILLPNRKRVEENDPKLAIDGVEAIVCHPLGSVARRLGAVGFSFATPRVFSSGERSFFDDAARQLALALERARLYEEARANHAMLGAIVGSAMDAIITADAEGRIILFNRAAEQMFGCPASDAVGDQLDRFVPRSSREELRKSGQLGTMLALREEGTEFPIEATASEFEVAGRRFCTVIVRDMTDRCRAEEALREADRRKDEFLAILGHELRNPLAPIMTALQLMKLRGDGGAEKERAVIERQVRHVSRLVDDLLDVSRISAGKVELKKEHLEAASIIARAIEMTRPLIEQRGHRLSVDVEREGLPIEVDRVRLAQAVGNLLTNAAKYTDPGGDITISARRQGQSVVISVRDNGIGLRSEALEQIFEPFVQVQRTVERSQGGIGLGLWLVKSLIEVHGGSVSVHSDGPGWGSEFTIALPASMSGKNGVEAATGQAYFTSVSRRVLIVDDNPDAADSLADLLRAVGHAVVVAHDAPDALAKADTGTFDVAILDIGLPIMDGHELARRLRLKPHAPMRFFAVTGYGTEEDRAKSRLSGFEAHFVKPFDHEELLASIEGPLASARSPTPAP